MNNKFLIQTEKGAMRFRCYVIEDRLAQLGLTFEEAGRRFGCPGNTIKRVAKGKNVTIDTLLRVSHSLNIKPADLLKEKVQFRRAVKEAVR